MTTSHHMVDDVINRLDRFNAEHGLYKKTDRLLLGVSGGKDSMAMLHLLSAMKLNLSVAHINFQLREQDSESDAEMVEKYCRDKAIPFHIRVIDTKTEANNKKLSIQEYARNARYAWFDELLTEHGYDAVAVAHHLDDSVETIIFNQLRGTGLKGLTGIPVKRDKIIRPMMCLWRTEIDELVEALGIPFREDISNASTAYSRNAIRHLVIPALERVKPSATSIITENARRLRRTYTEVEKMLAHFEQSVSKQVDNGCDVNRSDLMALPAPFSTLRFISEQYGFTEYQMNGILESKEQSGPFTNSDSHVMYVHRDFICIRPLSAISDVNVDLSLPGLTNTEIGGMQADLADPPDTFDTAPTVEYFDFDKLTNGLVLRTWHAGDRIHPLGMSGSQLVSDILTDHKLSYVARKNTIVLTCGKEILWVVGRKVSRAAKVTAETKRCLRLEWHV